MNSQNWKNSKYNWSFYELNPVEPLSQSAVLKLVENFYSDILSNKTPDSKFRVQCQLGFTYEQDDDLVDYRSLNNFRIINNSLQSKLEFIEELSNSVTIRESYYATFFYTKIFIKYQEVNPDTRLTIIKKDSNVESSVYKSVDYDINLSNSKDPNDWPGKIREISKSCINIITHAYDFLFKTRKDATYVTVSDKNLNKLIKFKDTIIPDTLVPSGLINNTRTFLRVFKKYSQIIINGKSVATIDNTTQFIRKLSKSNKNVFNIITMDLETRTLPFKAYENTKETMEVVSASLYSKEDGKDWYSSYYLTDYQSSESLLIKVFKDLLISKWNGYVVYLHNLSKFDGIFMLKILVGLVPNKNINLIIRNGELISIILFYDYFSEGKKKRGKIHFHDSKLLLNSSLKKLANNFSVEEKGFFDFKNINTTDTNILIQMKEELLKYNKQDCLVLYQILEKFNKEIFELFQLNITEYPTISSLSFAIYRSNYMVKGNIPISSLEVFKDISLSYKGGAVDVYKPYAEKVYVYDVNSLYPSEMEKNLFPVGKPVKFDKAIYPYNNIENVFGFVLAKVTCPDSINIPILLHRVGDKIIAGTGTWTDWYFSEELKYAITLGYKVEIIRGYHFKKERIFDKFVNALYNIRLQYAKDHSKNLIAKLLLNSLYGRFGMSPVQENYEVYDKDTMLEKDYSNAISLFNNSTEEGKDSSGELEDKEIISTISTYNKKNMRKDGKLMNISTSIASAVTAYGRIQIHKYKMLAGDSLCYSDTDSIFTESVLPNTYVNNDLGSMKLEYKDASKGIFISPKVYGLKFPNGDEIVKVKGYKGNISFDQLTLLLNKGAELNLSQKIWLRDIPNGTINITDLNYTLKLNEGKRTYLYLNNKVVGTKPINILEYKSLTPLKLPFYLI